MTGIASKSQLRMSFLRYALFTVPGVLLVGTLVGTLSGSGSDNPWYQALVKPDYTPPGWTFAIVWPILYVLLGLSLAMILHARGAKGRERVFALFLMQLLLNFAWSPVFFGLHKIGVAMTIIAALVVINAVLIVMAWRVRRLAALLLVPYLAWLIFAAMLNFEIVARNPNAETLVPGAASTDIPL
jgi:tryptophan-rich sensory protein